MGEQMLISQFYCYVRKILNYRNPNGKARAYQVGWPNFEANSSTSRHVLRIGPYEKLNETEIITTIVQEDRSERCAFWNELFPKLSEFKDKKCENDLNNLEASSNPEEFLPIKPRIKEELPKIKTKVNKPKIASKIRENAKYPKKPVASLPSVINSLKKLSPLHTDDPGFKIKKINKNKFINDMGTKVMFRMNVQHDQDQDNWDFYQSTESGDDPVVIFDDSKSTIPATPK